jgi:hypothetical protein
MVSGQIQRRSEPIYVAQPIKRFRAPVVTRSRSIYIKAGGRFTGRNPIPLAILLLHCLLLLLFSGDESPWNQPSCSWRWLPEAVTEVWVAAASAEEATATTSCTNRRRRPPPNGRRASFAPRRRRSGRCARAPTAA